MAGQTKNWMIHTGVISGVFVICLYCMFTFTSYALFPIHFIIGTRWLSDLGNSSFNPSGAILYNIGCITTGIALVPFFYCLWVFHETAAWKKALLILGQAAGFIDAFSLIMIGIFSENYGYLHIFWSVIFFGTNVAVLIIMSISLLFSTKFMKWIVVYGFAVAAVNVVYFLGTAAPVMEWITVFTGLGLVGLITANLLSKVRKS
jgi:hypothetical membrane protein